MTDTGAERQSAGSPAAGSPQAGTQATLAKKHRAADFNNSQRTELAVWQIIRQTLSYVSHFGPQEWLLSFLAVVGVGIVCMRGFGSRSSY
jgi:hypothetical protein